MLRLRNEKLKKVRTVHSDCVSKVCLKRLTQRQSHFLARGASLSEARRSLRLVQRAAVWWDAVLKDPKLKLGLGKRVVV